MELNIYLWATLYIELSVKVFFFNSLVFAVIEKTSTVKYKLFIFSIV